MAKVELENSAPHKQTISRDELRARLDDRGLVILDVMPKETYADGHIPSSINLPLAEVEATARQLISSLSQEIAVYCAGPT
jgi:rhodanese-related sulfurtransferase